MKKIEQSFGNKIQKWMKYNMRFSYLFELKIVNLSKTKKLYYDKTFLDEVDRLCAGTKNFIYKISDFSGFGSPFDGVAVWGSAAFVFIQFYKPREKKFYVIEISKIINDISSGSKGIDEAKALEMCYLCGVMQ